MQSITIANLAIPRTGLVTVNFRQNLLKDVSAWAGAACKDSLEDLEFRDNQLSEVRSTCRALAFATSTAQLKTRICAHP